LVGHKHAAFVVKSNAYGHGLVETALAAEPFARRICTYSLEEAVILRDGGITAPILVLGPVAPANLDVAMAAKLDLALWSTGDFARRLAAAARKRRIRAPVHVKVNTGLNRLGFDPHELADAVEDLLHVGEIEIAGVYSHLSSAEELDSPATLHQLAVFEKALVSADPLFERGAIVPLRHIAASAAAMLWPQTRLDLARFGIATYGLWPSKQTREAMDGSGLELQPALTYLSQIVVVRTVPPGAPVGYGATFHAPREMRLGVVPAGYGDGIPRALSNRGAFLVDGVVCPIVGRIAMNLTEIDLTHAPRARRGSQVTLIGRDGDVQIGADDWAEWAQTVNYEIVARLPSEIPRIYEDPVAGS
jgi:alanine racemase